MDGKTLSSQLISFFINTWAKDSDLTFDLLRQIRQFYPKISIFVSSDGPASPELQQNCANMDAILAEGERLKHQADTNAWTIRMFDLMSQIHSEYIIKIDPDCKINRPILLPKAEFDIAAKFLGGARLIGPCIIFNREAVSNIRSSGLLESLLPASYRFSRGAPLEELHTQDDLLRRIIPQLNLRTVDLPDANIAWIAPPEDQESGAICHPRIDSLPLLGQLCSWPNGDGKTLIYNERVAQEIIKESASGINL